MSHSPPRQGAPAPKQRRALSHVGGEVTVQGDRDAGSRLAEALDVAPSDVNEEQARAHVHGFHVYPARMHPHTARRLIEAFSKPLAAVLDPFCGSGTVLVEARLAGRFAAGVDANPLAVRLARLKATTTTEEQRSTLVRWAHNIQATAESRRQARSGASRRLPDADVTLFEPHVLLELDSLRVGLEGFAPRSSDETWARDALWLVFSAILTKVSRRASETSSASAPRRIAAGYSATLFARKAEELARRLAEIAPLLAGAPGLWVEEGDARVLDGIEDGAVDLTVTSPPYAGVYDYVAHHEARLRWLGLDHRRFRAREIGARERFSETDPDLGRAAWGEELGAVLRSLRRVTRDGGLAVLLLSDSTVGGEPIFADDAIVELSEPSGFECVSIASQARPHFHGKTARAFAKRPRREHALLLSAVRPERASRPPRPRGNRTAGP